MPSEQVKVLSNEFAGKPYQDKLEELRKELDKKKSVGFVICEVVYSMMNAQSLTNCSHAGRSCLVVQPARQ